MTRRVAPAPSVPGIRPAVLPWRYSPRGVAIRLFVTCWLVYALHFATNIEREIYPALSLGDHASFDVSEYLGLHDDIFALPGRGAFINNNPGASILGAIPYALARPIIDRIVERVQRNRAAFPQPPPEYNAPHAEDREFYRKAYERGLDVKFGLASGVVQALLMAPLSAISAVVMFRVLLGLTSSVQAALLLALLYAFATPIFYRTAQLNHNLLVSHFAFFAFALLWRAGDDPSRPQRPNYLLAGLLCGWAVVLDYSGLIVLLALSLYALVRRSSLPRAARSSLDLPHFFAGAGFSIAVLMAYQWLCFGNPFYPAQYYMPPAEYTHYGHRGIDWPQLDLLWDTAFGVQFGLFTSAPLLLLALHPPAWLSARTRLVGGLEVGCIAAFSLGFFLLCAVNQYGRMQVITGVRYIVPVAPFLFLLAAGVLLRLPPVLTACIGLIATYWSWCLAMYRDVQQGPGVFASLIHVTFEGFRLPWLTTLERMGHVREASALPLLVLVTAIIWVLWNVGRTDSNGRSPL